MLVRQKRSQAYGLDERAAASRSGARSSPAAHDPRRCFTDAPCPPPWRPRREASSKRPPQSARPQLWQQPRAPTPSRRGAGRRRGAEKITTRRNSTPPIAATACGRVVVVRGEARGCVARRAVESEREAEARAWLNATPGCSSSSRWMYWGNFRFMPKTPVTTAPMPIVIEMAVAITSILSSRLRAWESRGERGGERGAAAVGAAREAGPQQRAESRRNETNFSVLSIEKRSASSADREDTTSCR